MPVSNSDVGHISHTSRYGRVPVAMKCVYKIYFNKVVDMGSMTAKG